MARTADGVSVVRDPDAPEAHIEGDLVVISKLVHRQRGPRLRWAMLSADLGAVALAMVAAFLLKTVLPGRDPSGAPLRHLVLGALSLPVWAAMYSRGRLYSTAHTAARLDEFRRLVHATLLSAGITAMLGFILKIYVSRGWLVLSAVFAVLFVVLERSGIRHLVARARAGGRLMEPVLIIGANLEALAVAGTLLEEPSLGYRVVGFLDDETPVGALVLEDLSVLGRLDEVLEVAARVEARRAIVATTALNHERSNRLIRQLARAGIDVELSSSLYDINPARLVVRPLGRFPLIYIEPVRRTGWQVAAKRTFDVAFSAVAGLLCMPLFGAVALLIKLDSSGPVFFRQKRIGQDGRMFQVCKFRTMVTEAERHRHHLRDRNEADGPLFKLRRDPRCTRVGRLLRALSIDELPQLWNVVRGDMSLVGPRPALPEEVSLWTPDLHERLRVKPGITGMWQVSGSRRWSSFEDYIRLDLYYVDNWSVWTDLAILAKTVPTVLLRRGAV
jgi:exopolysaccharide biosynthesis polyprenyl glycosylphosphotransferase